MGNEKTFCRGKTRREDCYSGAGVLTHRLNHGHRCIWAGRSWGVHLTQQGPLSDHELGQLNFEPKLRGKRTT